MSPDGPTASAAMLSDPALPILGIEIAVDDVSFVQVRERLRHVLKDRPAMRGRESSVVQRIRKALTAHQLEHQSKHGRLEVFEESVAANQARLFQLR